MSQIGIASIQQFSIESGTWDVADLSGAGLVFPNHEGHYLRIGAAGGFFFWRIYVTFPVTANAANVKLSLPNWMGYGSGSIQWSDQGTIYETEIVQLGGISRISLYNAAGGNLKNSDFSGKEVMLVGTGQSR